MRIDAISRSPPEIALSLNNAQLEFLAWAVNFDFGRSRLFLKLDPSLVWPYYGGHCMVQRISIVFCERLLCFCESSQRKRALCVKKPSNSSDSSLNFKLTTTGNLNASTKSDPISTFFFSRRPHDALIRGIRWTYSPVFRCMQFDRLDFRVWSLHWKVIDEAFSEKVFSSLCLFKLSDMPSDCCSLVERHD